MISHDAHIFPELQALLFEVYPAVAELRPEDLTCSPVDINLLFLLMFP